MTADPRATLRVAADTYRADRALLIKAIVDADTAGVPKAEIARISGFSRRGVYDILEKADRI